MTHRSINIGHPVMFIDEHRVARPALVTQVWGSPTYSLDGAPGAPLAPGLNVVLVNSDDKMKDDCGRQKLNKTSVVHVSIQPAAGYCWREMTPEDLAGLYQ